MDALEFACFFNRFEKLLNLHLEPEIVSLIYSDYNKSFERYTFFELIYMLKKHMVSLEYPLNKAKIIDKIKKDRINIPEINNDIKKRVTKWCLYNARYDNYYIFLCEYFISIVNEDVIEFANGIRYRIHDINYDFEEEYKNESAIDYNHYIYNNKYVIVQLENLKTHTMILMTGNEFMNIMDDEDITYVSSKYQRFF